MINLRIIYIPVLTLLVLLQICSSILLLPHAPPTSLLPSLSSLTLLPSLSPTIPLLPIPHSPPSCSSCLYPTIPLLPMPHFPASLSSPLSLSYHPSPPYPSLSSLMLLLSLSYHPSPPYPSLFPHAPPISLLPSLSSISLTLLTHSPPLSLLPFFSSLSLPLLPPSLPLILLLLSASPVPLISSLSPTSPYSHSLSSTPSLPFPPLSLSTVSSLSFPPFPPPPSSPPLSLISLLSLLPPPLLLPSHLSDMTKIHPAIFNLQATEKNISQLLPQLLQDPFFFYQLGQESDYSINNSEDDYPLSSLTGCMHDEALANGHIRLALPVDTAIYVLIKSHCSKGARQAEEMINTSLNGNYVMSHNLTDFHVMPPIIKFCSSKVNQSGSSTHRKISSEIGNCVCDVTVGGVSSKPFQSTSSLCLERNIGIPLFPPDERPDSVSRKNSNSSNLADVSNVSSSSSVACIPISDCVLSSENQNTLAHTSSKRKRHSTSSMIQEIEPIIEEEREFSGTLPPSPPRIGNGHQQCQTTLMKPLSNSKGRKMSIYHAPTRKDSTGSDTSVGDAPCYIPGGDQWNTSIIDNNTIIAQYGAMPYPMVFWDPKFMIDFHLNTSTGLLSDKVTGIDLSKPEVTLRVINNLPKRIGFAIRSNRLSTVFKTHVVYPNRGLEIVDAYKSWEDKVEFYPNNPDMMDMFAVDLFFCTMDAKPVWNIIRKYAIMKAQKTWELAAVSVE